MNETGTSAGPILPTPYNIRAVAHNAIQATLATLDSWMRLTYRVKVADAVVAAVEPLIRASERERIAELSARFRTPVTYPNGYPVEAIPWAAFLDLMAARNLEGK